MRSDSDSNAANVAIIVLTEIQKTFRRPGRIVAIPFYLALTLLQRPRRFLGPYYRKILVRIAALVGAGGDPAPNGYLQQDFVSANDLFDQNRPVEAMKYYERCLKNATEPLIFFLAAACQMVGLGRYNDAMVLLRRANELRWQGVSSDFKKWRVLDGHFWANVFGHSALIDYVIKLGIMEGRPSENTILYVPSDVVRANKFLIEQWRPHLRIVEAPEDLPFPEKFVAKIRYDYFGPLLEDGSTGQLWEVAAKTYKRWHDQGRQPLLSFPSDVREKGRATMKRAGIPADAWFVGLHMREIGSKAKHLLLHNVLNTQVTDYFPAIEEVTKRGGWVIRLGDPSMMPLPSMPNVWDYCHSSERCDWMDIFLCSQCRFLIGSSSGPAYVPPLYGVPSVLTNWWPPAQRPWHPHDIFMPKLYRSNRTGGLLSLADSLSEPFGYCNSTDYLSEKFHVTVQANEPEEISAAVIEMFARIDGTAQYSAEDLVLRERAERLYEASRAYGMGILARDFLRKYRSILD